MVVKFPCLLPYQIDLVGNNLADWGDGDTRIVCEIFADEVMKGHRSSTHLNMTGYNNVIARFKERTGIALEGNSRVNETSLSNIMVFGTN
jgi:GTPase